MPAFNSGSVFAFIQGCGVTDHGTGQVTGWGGGGVVMIRSASSPGAIPKPHMFVLFSGLTATKVKGFTKIILDAKVASGFQLVDALSYEVVAVIGTLPEADLAQLRQPSQRVVTVIDPNAVDAKASLKTFLDR